MQLIFAGAVTALWLHWFFIGLWFHFSSADYVFLFPGFLLVLSMWLTLLERDS